MSVLIVTSLGDIVVDLHADLCPLTSKNFLKLCKIKYYNGCLFHTVQKDFTAQAGDPTGTGSGGDSIYKFLYGDQARFFGDEIRLDLKHSKMGTVAMASAGEDLNASQFYITLRDDIYYLDGKHTVFGEVAEGLETLNRINEAYVDEKGRPYKNIRIKHTYVLDDPFDDPPQLSELVPDASPEGKPKDEVRLEDDWVPMDEQLAPGELEEVIRTKEAHSRAVVLESIGDIPDAEIKPPDNVLFVCKLNPVTEDEDLHTIFSRFGTVTSADIIRDYKTGDSLCYAFIEFENKDSCEQAYFKMDNALIDDRRIHVDFSQSVARLWLQYKRKDNQAGKGRGYFKCGYLDHIAKDCTGSPTGKQQTAKYILKDNNTQRGGDNNSGYEMVFDGDETEIPSRDKRHRDHEAEDHYGKQKLNRQSSDELKQRDYKTRNLHDPNRQHERSKEYSRSEIHRRSSTSPSFRREKRGQSTKDELDYKRNADGGGSRRRDRRDDRSSRENDDSLGDERDDRGEYKKRSEENERGYRRRDERGSHSYTRRSTDRGEKRDDDRDYYKKRSADSGRDDDRSHRLERADDGIRGSRDDTYDRKIQAENDGRKSSRGEERNKEKSTKGSDGYYDRTRERDRRH